MIRGMHYMCWHERDWNYHPSMPMKRLQNIQDIVDMRGNLLLWSCLGSGAIGLPYLDREANEDIPPRLRFYGHINDSEFCSLCKDKGISAYAVIWKSQLWEFPAEFNEDETELLSLNKMRGVGKSGWIGIRELSTDRYPKIFPSIRKYFPEGLRNSDGELVHDFLEEFRVKTLDGNSVCSSWLMVPGHDHVCYTPCGNNPAYMEYLFKEIEIMIDANASGILVDEFDTQMHSVNNAGCFCKDCMKGFRAWLRQHPCEAAEGLDLDSFDYGNFLRARGLTDNDLLSLQGERRLKIPLMREFIAYQNKGSEYNVRDIAAYAKQYAKKKYGIQNFPVTANLFNCLPHGAGVRKYCDIIAGETSDVNLRQDGFSRFANAFFGGKDGSFIEDPSEHIFDMVQDIRNGKNDQYILFITEALAHGFNTAIPYGAWLMNFRQDTIYPPFEVEKKLGPWLTQHQRLFTNQLEADVALVYDQRYALETHLYQGGLSDEHKNGGFQNFFQQAQNLCDAHVLFNVLYVDEDEALTPERLKGYHTLILPDCCMLDVNDKQAIQGFAESGGRVAAVGRVSEDFYPHRFRYTKYTEMIAWIKGRELMLEIEDRQRYLSVSLQKTEKGHALHLINYNVNNKTRMVESIEDVNIRLSFTPKHAVVHSFPEHSATRVSRDGNALTVKNMGVYAVIELED